MSTQESRGIDYPTLGIAVIIYGGFIALTCFFHALPLWLSCPLGSVLLAWHGSLQHETIHGHPTASRRLNSMLGAMPLSLWIPYPIYRETHLRHHRHGGRHLTDVARDPESYYLRPGTLDRVGAVRKAILQANRTLAGRMLFGPALSLTALWTREARKVWAGDRRRRLIWFRHGLGVAMMLYWLIAVCHIPMYVYVALIIYPSVSLSQVRSFAEHRADEHSHRRTRVVEAGGLWSLIFLNNNLHIAHHAHPQLPWHELPRAWRQMRHSVKDSALVIHGGYREVIRNYLFRPLISAEHPGVATSVE